MSTRSPALIVAARAILLALAALAATYAFVLSRPESRASQAAQRRYSCPMHPKVTAAGPASCPICGMALTETRSARLGQQEQARPDPSARAQGVVDVARRRIFSQEQRASAWVAGDRLVRALLYQDDLASLEPAERALFQTGGGPPVAVRLGQAPPVPWDARTSTVDFVVERNGPSLPAGATGSIELPAKPRTVLIVSSSAVLESSEGPYVFASADGRSFTRRPVAVGKTLNGLTAVVSGLREQERVIIRGAFFLDSQARLEAGPESVGADGQ